MFTGRLRSEIPPALVSGGTVYLGLNPFLITSSFLSCLYSVPFPWTHMLSETQIKTDLKMMIKLEHLVAGGFLSLQDDETEKN